MALLVYKIAIPLVMSKNDVVIKDKDENFNAQITISWNHNNDQSNSNSSFFTDEDITK